MAAKELYAGCEEQVNSAISEGSKNPEYRDSTNQTDQKSKHNTNPIGFKWVDEEGWVSLEDEQGGAKPIGQFELNFCSDSMRFRKGGYRKFLHGQINQVCL